MDAAFEAKLNYIRKLLAEAYEHYFSYEGHCKSSEGAISINYPPFFWREDGAAEEPSISIYSYCLGPHRDHYFRTIDEAVEEVRKWHRDEMSYDPNEPADMDDAEWLHPIGADLKPIRMGF